MLNCTYKKITGSRHESGEGRKLEYVFICTAGKSADTCRWSVNSFPPLHVFNAVLFEVYKLRRHFRVCFSACFTNSLLSDHSKQLTYYSINQSLNWLQLLRVVTIPILSPHYCPRNTFSVWSFCYQHAHKTLLVRQVSSTEIYLLTGFSFTLQLIQLIQLFVCFVYLTFNNWLFHKTNSWVPKCTELLFFLFNFLVPFKA